MASAISCPLWLSVSEYQRVECGMWSVVCGVECGMCVDVLYLGGI